MDGRSGKGPKEGRKPLHFRGRVLDGSTLRLIRRAALRADTRVQISGRVCRQLEWRRPNGDLAIRSCMALLNRLEKKGLLRLPLSPVARRPRTRGADAECARAPATGRCTFEFQVPGDDARGLLVRPVLQAERDAFRAAMAQHHYLGYRQPPGESILHVGFWERKPVALVSWASATLHNAARDRWLGWDPDAKSRRLHLVATNVRFLILPLEEETKVSHLASQTLAASLRRLSRDYESAYGHRILLAETFVDQSRFHGTCYQASNWICVGETSGWSRRGTVYWKHGERKAVFLYPLHRRFRDLLAGAQSPVDTYGHKETTVILDASRLPLDGDGCLFEVLRRFKDPRDPRGIRHSLPGLLAQAAVARLGGAKSFEAMAHHVRELPGELRVRLGGSEWKSPDESTFRRLFKRFDIAAFDREIGGWFARQEEVSGQGLAIDGKTMRGSYDGDSVPVHLVSAVLHKGATVVAQTRVAEKSNEITSVQPLLDEINIEGAVVTGDAMFAQTKIAEYIVEEKKADYLVTVKDNQPTLRIDIENMSLEAFSPGVRRAQPGARSD